MNPLRKLKSLLPPSSRSFHGLCGEVLRMRGEMTDSRPDGEMIVQTGAVPLATVGAPTAAIFFACYLWLIPLYNLIVNIIRGKRK